VLAILVIHQDDLAAGAELIEASSIGTMALPCGAPASGSDHHRGL